MGLVDDHEASDRREALRKIVYAVAGTGFSALLLGTLTGHADASNVVPSSGMATFDGPVGIGTSSPSYPLQIDTVYAYGLYLNSIAGTAGIAANAPSGVQSTFDWQTAGTMKWRLLKQTDDSWLLVNSGGTSMIAAFQSGTLALNPYGGNVGIGTANPTSKLTVAGDVGHSLVSSNGLVKAAALVNGSASIIRSFNNLPGGSGPTVTQPLGPGTYEVNFGANVAQRFFSATLLTSNSTDPGGANDGQALVSTRDGNVNAVFVRTNDSTGTSANRSFYLMIF
jgi:hypothetical protein